ncbi:MAG: branched-chain amino acid ABC transporter permease [Bacillota bacterium]|nr:branched-chain amino acid ABC transporter permease [Bacillota bacterium]
MTTSMIAAIITKNKYKVIFLVAMLVLLVLAPQFVSRFTVTLITLCFVYSILAMSLDLLAGYMGYASLGHAAFFGVAAYSVAIANTKMGYSFLPSVIFSLAITIFLALIFGLLVSSLKGVQFTLVNLALGQVIWGVAYRWYNLTGGDDGLRGVARPEIGSLVLRGDSFYYFALIVFVVSLICLVMLVQSPFGQTIRGIKLSESRMRVLGYNVFLHKYLNYIIAGFFAGVAGILMVYFNTYIGPSSLEVFASASALLMVLVGGAGTLFGPIIGASFVVLLENFFSAQTERWMMIMGLLYVSVVLFLPGGIFGLFKNLINRIFSRKIQKPVSDSIDK